LSATGPQTQRLALVSTLNNTDNNYKLHADTVRNTALSQIAGQSGLISSADPLWVLYYSQELSPVINNSAISILGGLPPQISAKLVSEGLYAWYKNKLDMLKERVNGARSADMDRGSRILAYYRLLKEYRTLAGVWAIRTSSAQMDIKMTAQQQQLKTTPTKIDSWTPQTDVQIANKILQHANY
jgi:hypothetical protein